MIFITGDMHGVMERFQDLRFPGTSKRGRADYGVISASFGREPRMKRRFCEAGKRKKYEILFDGPDSQNFNLLEKYPQEEYAGGKAHRVGANIRLSGGEPAVHHRGQKYLPLAAEKDMEKGGPGQGWKWWKGKCPPWRKCSTGWTGWTRWTESGLYRHP